MNQQRSDLISSRHALEAKGDRFGCMQCGAELPRVMYGHTSDLCDACDEKDARKVAEEYAALRDAGVL